MIDLTIMAKAPVAGYAKTRLIPALGADGAAQLAARLLNHTLQQARAAGFARLTLACAPDADHPGFAMHGDVARVAQGQGDLGARMRRQFERAFEQGAERALVIGTDAPALDAALLRRAADALADCDAVFVPAFDGGYALIGLRRLPGVLPALFEAMPWSTSAVMAATRERLEQAAWRHSELPAVHDIDEAVDLVHLPKGWL
jgi:uncharacterized protein